MRLTTFVFSLSLFFIPMTPMAGSGHDHSHDDGHNHSHEPVTQVQAEEVANRIVAQLVEKGKIDNSWQSVKVNHAMKKKFGNNMEWVINFKNKNISDPDKQTLYVFLTLSGEYIAANYSGN